MGKYSQWLYHREIDQQLRERLELIEQELHTLQEQAALLEDAASCSDNSILQAIAMQQSAQVLLEDTPTLSDNKKYSSKSVSSALFAWSSLPNLDPQKVQMPGIAPNEQQPEVTQQPSIPHPEIPLAPIDTATFMDADEQTLPQIHIPKWLRKAPLATNTTDHQRSLPDERTNTSIQRWLERWGKQVPDPSQHTAREGSEK